MQHPLILLLERMGTYLIWLDTRLNSKYWTKFEMFGEDQQQL